MVVPVRGRWEVAAFLSLTAATGLIDAVSYLALGRTFVANMTGNVVFLGFAVSPESGFTVVAPLFSLAGFLLGSLVGGRAAAVLEDRPRRWLGIVFGAQALLLAIAALLVATDVLQRRGGTSYGLIFLLAGCFGVQNATVRHAGPKDMTTTVLTLTLTGLAADSVLGGGRSASPYRRLASVAAMLAGAAVGALLLQATISGVILLAAAAVALAAGIFVFGPAPAEAPKP
ncbi:MAG: hypothetical protein QOF10_4880 [Kribbellaceae bacterium]|jgi:uncharacterized membrane protein YoaK (UPF0700 family)|nr:hypothetical protein [Kribbellaceae bacterium]